MLCGEFALVCVWLPTVSRVHYKAWDPLKQQYGATGAIVLHLADLIPSGVGHDVFWQLFHSCNYSVKCCARKHLLPAVTDQTSVKSTFWTQKRKWQKSGHGSECVVSADGSLAITRWMDNRIVALVSNFIAVEEGDIVRRCIRAKNRSVDVKWQAVINACNYSIMVSREWTSDFFLKDYHSLIKGDIENDVSYEPYSGERLPWVQVWRGQRAFLGSPISLTSS